ncbi:MAG: hypothetical protein O3B45_07325, partial [Bacteroidetes bacterium]|nr:hypothetical protein [Bacteroidota bacterium]
MTSSHASSWCSLVLIATAFFCVSNVQAQTQITGRVLDHSTGESLVGASVYLEEFSTGGMTDF